MLDPRGRHRPAQRRLRQDPPATRALHAKGTPVRRHLHRDRRGGRAVPGRALAGRRGRGAGAVVQRLRAGSEPRQGSQDVRGMAVKFRPTCHRAAPPTCSARPRRASRCAPPRTSSPSPRRLADPKRRCRCWLARHSDGRSRRWSPTRRAKVRRAAAGPSPRRRTSPSTPTAGAIADDDRSLGALHAGPAGAARRDRPAEHLEGRDRLIEEIRPPGWRAGPVRFDLRVTVAAPATTRDDPMSVWQGRPRAQRRPPRA